LLRRYSVQEIASLNDRIQIEASVGLQVSHYLNYRSEVIEKRVVPMLMDRNHAKQEFESLYHRYQPTCKLPMNKQKKEKQHYNYLTCILNILTEANLKGSFNDEPRNLVVITDSHNRPVKVLSRWMDGAYPGIRNPVAVWEVKEYYGTTTFGSRVADGVYETQLDGYEILDVERLTGKRIEHYLIVDDRFTWWDKGKSYLCRLIDMMHMGLVDEVVFGREILTRWPQIVRRWSAKRLPR
jgi:hypothetical protein